MIHAERTELDGDEESLRRASAAWRHERATATLTALQALAPGWTHDASETITEELQHAVLGHALLAAKQAVQTRDEAFARAALSLARAKLEDHPALFTTALGPVLVIDHRGCAVADTTRYESTPYFLTVDALERQPPIASERLARACMHIIEAGLGREGAPWPTVLIALDEHDESEPTTSYSLLGFPATVFTDWTSSAVRLGEAYLHESAHCWLNDQLHAHGEQLPLTPCWYSPWKDCERPAFGILHAVLAFSWLTRYFAFHARSVHVTPFERIYCETRCGIERRNLVTMAPALQECLRHLRTTALARRIERAHHEALVLSDLSERTSDRRKERA